MAVLLLYLAVALAGAALAFWRAPAWPRYSLLLAIAAVPQLGMLLGIRLPAMFVVSVVAVLIWCRCNFALAGVPAISVGVVMNMLVMALNGGAMPIHTATLARIGVTAAPGMLLAGSKDLAVQTALLGLLGDWLVLPAGVATYVVSPGDIVVAIGLLWWLLFSNQYERLQPMMMARTATAPEPRARLIQGQSTRPALTRLALLAAANRSVAESLLRDPLDAAALHPHYVLALDARDRATLADIRARTSTVGEFLADLADIVDGVA
ncbi:MAG: DUF5317 family protein [Kouleothrix sp.]|jgi:hypothetical protein|nr:DUF5317 domain-containing protein [Kouleothrix sp.]